MQNLEFISNERMDWSEVVKRYPDKWVLFYDFEEVNGEEVNGLVLCVCNDKDLDANMVKYDFLPDDKLVSWTRTTEPEGVCFCGMTI